MLSPLAQAIRKARRSCGLTQAQLAARLELKARSVLRWENDRGAPTRRHQRALLQIIAEVNKPAADKLSENLVNHGKPPPPPAAPAPSAPAVDPRAYLEHAVFTMADELDMPPRRVRGSLVRFLRSVGATSLTLQSTREYLELWNANAPPPNSDRTA
jgi:transcriptional regulator with XRE-family HTH domain